MNTSFIRAIILILLPVFVFAGCLLIPDIYFTRQDNKTFGVIDQQNLEAVDLKISSEMSITDKLFIISHVEDYTFVNLNFDYNDAYSYNDVRNMAVTELSDMLGTMNLPFYVDGIYEAFIDKYMVSYTRDPKLNFVVWNVDIRYFGCPMQVILDYETSSILYFSFDLRTTMNTWHSAEEFQAISYYDTAIVPFLDFLRADETDSNKAHLDALDEAFTNMLLEYYGFRAISTDAVANATERTSVTYEVNKFVYKFYGIGNSDTNYFQIEENNLSLSINSYIY